jgi:HlyD family secretion protein
MQKRRSISLIVAVALILGGTIVLESCAKSATTPKKQSYEFTSLSKGTIESVVSSSGTLSVVSSVSVLAEMSGRIKEVNVDYNSKVKAGQVLATINTDLLKLQARAAQASVDKAQANYDLQALALQNAKALFDKGLLSEYDYKSSQSSLNVEKANLSSAKASLEQIETQINQYAIITSPIDGIVLERDIDPGSSVVGGSSSATSLFTIAGDLSSMQIKAQVDELDIASIKVGQEVRFTVEANPGETFSGSVKEIRLVPETSSNVVYYYVIILASNKSGKLLPGMTASVSFIKQKAQDVVVVPNAALRFTPTSLTDAEKQKALFLAGLGNLSAAEKEEAAVKYDEMQKAIAAQAKSGKATAQKATGLTSLMGGQGGGPGGAPGGMGGGFGGPPGMGGSGSRRSSSSGSSKTGQSGQTVSAAAGESAGSSGTAVESVAVKKALWYLDDAGKLAAAMVEVGVSDGTKTQITGAGADALEGKKIILKVKAE